MRGYWPRGGLRERGCSTCDGVVLFWFFVVGERFLLAALRVFYILRDGSCGGPTNSATVFRGGWFGGMTCGRAFWLWVRIP